MPRRIITLEEHFADSAVGAAGRERSHELSPGFPVSYAPSTGLPYTPTPDQLTDLGEGRIADMDANGITVQVLSSLGAQYVPAPHAAELVGAANDRAAAAVREHPDRFAAFAALPTTVPETAADELSRCVEELGFVGSLIHGRTDDEFLDAERFAPILARHEALDVPLYLHPAPPPAATSATNYDGLGDIVTARFQTSAWGWHNETAVHFIHLVLAGVFDRYPRLQIVLGHWGELVPFYLDRLDEALPQAATGLDRTFGEVFRQNVYITPSGMFTQANLDYCVATLGVDRIMYAVDYPFVGQEGAAEFLEQAKLTDAEKDLIGAGTAARVLGL
ncbi:amidohydrolase family protein [Rathayibacter sp. CAU 1779]